MRVELARDGVAFSLRSRHVVVDRAPAHQLRFHRVAQRRAFELAAPGIDHPHAGTLSELRSEVEAVVPAAPRTATDQRHLRRRPAPASGSSRTERSIPIMS